MIEAVPVFDTRVGNFAASVANRFVMPTLVLAGVSLLLSPENIAQAASLLMFDPGTGLRVSVPTVIVSALTRAGSQGLLIRSGYALVFSRVVQQINAQGYSLSGSPLISAEVVSRDQLDCLKPLRSLLYSLEHVMSVALF
jgi:hypothetical protein